jgi:alkyl hydroperoxide reductase subunit AhpC
MTHSFIRSKSSEESSFPMAIQLGDVAPDFTAPSTAGEITFHEWLGNDWAVLFSHPRDFTPVCTTELGAVARLKPEFDKRGVKVIGLSVDGVSDHEGWSRDIAETQGAALNFPLVADPTREVANAYGMLHPNADTTATVRSVFVIDDQKKVRLTLTYPASTGRNFQEILRVIDALKLTSSHAVSTPADWQRGEDVIIAATLDDEQAKAKFPNGWRAERPYLRYVPDPSAKADEAAA